MRAKLWPGGSSNNCREVTWCHHTMDVPLADGDPGLRCAPAGRGRWMSKPQQRQAGQTGLLPSRTMTTGKKRQVVCVGG
jgi:hypothetical protein